MVNEIVLSSSVPGFVPLDVDDDDDEVEGRILSEEELIARLHERGDIFAMDGEKRLITSEMFSVCCAIIAGLWITETEPTIIKAIPESSVNPFGTTTVLDKPIQIPPAITRPLPPREVSVNRKVLHPTRNTHSGSQMSKSGVGDPRSRVARTGVFAAILSQQTRGKAVAGDITAMGGYAEGIDVIISGTGGLKQGVGSGIVRRENTGIGFADGYGDSGFGGDGPAGIDDLIGGGPDLALDLKPHHSSEPRNIALKVPTGVGFIGGRNRAEIMRVVLQNIQSLRYAYNKRLMDKPGLKGKIVCKFAIDESGNVLACDLIESTLSDGVLETIVNNLILHWKFEKIDKPGDITEIVYPFMFSS